MMVYFNKVQKTIVVIEFGIECFSVRYMYMYIYIYMYTVYVYAYISIHRSSIMFARLNIWRMHKSEKALESWIWFTGTFQCSSFLGAM